MDLKPSYALCATGDVNLLTQPFDAPAWATAKPIQIAHFRPESSSHRPQTLCRLTYSEKGFHGIFKVADQYVRAAHVGFQNAVWKDSCVEVFVQPRSALGYFNFEMNCGGSLLCSYVTDPTRLPGGALKTAVEIPENLGSQIRVRSTLPQRVDPEITEPLTWELAFFIPFTVLEAFTGPLGPKQGQKWRANFYKCAEEVSHPHWAAWSPVTALNFHLPKCSGTIEFT